ncbi:MAG: ABC-2 transporter permease, partial [Acetatifactor sp.]|nr:ABC-2 transporter permease [Acetatifactor sp.]
LSKYVFGGVLGSFAWVLAVVLYFAANVVQGLEWSTGDIAPVVLVPVTIFAVLLSVLVPVELKFGSEKGRIVLMLIFGVAALAALLGGKALAALNLDTTALVARLDAIPDAAIYGVVIGIIVSFVAVSILISVKVMENKEF